MTPAPQTRARHPKVVRARKRSRGSTKTMAAENPTYAIVKTGGKQYKVAVGDIVKVEKLELAKDLEKVSVTAEVLEHTKGPKIRIHKFKNKTGYHKRQGHRQKLTVVKVTGIK
jgi:large subunit ribosomal protein L21